MDATLPESVTKAFEAKALRFQTRRGGQWHDGVVLRCAGRDLKDFEVTP